MSIFNLFKSDNQKRTDEGIRQNSTNADAGQKADVESCKDETPTPEMTATEGTKRVHNLILLDESGSMQSIYQPAMTGVNETLQTIREAQKEHPEQTHFVSLIAFDSNHYNRIYSNTPAEKTTDITQEQYRPCGCTPLYDAMGRSITELRSNVAKGDVVLMTVITDGYENSSIEYNGKAIQSLVEAMKKEGWVFTYIGANQDVDAVADSLSIDNKLAFEANAASACAMFARENRSRKKFFGKLSDDQSDFSKGYFDEDGNDDFPY